MTVVGTGISWTNSTWNPWVGCKPVSAGCDNCYAAALVNGPRGRHFGHRFDDLRLHLERLPQVRRFKPIVGADGKKQPHLVFVNSMSDFFYEDVPDAAIHQVLDVLEQHPTTVFQILSKRPIRARQIITGRWGNRGVPKHIWFGFSVEDNRVAGRIKILRSIKERVGEMVAFLSVEPIVGPTDELSFEGLDWIITGGESGPKARTMRREWLLTATQKAQEQGVPLWHKQNGSWRSHPNLLQVPRGSSAKTGTWIMNWLIEHGWELLPEEKGGATIDRQTYRQLPPVVGEIAMGLNPLI